SCKKMKVVILNTMLTRKQFPKKAFYRLLIKNFAQRDDNRNSPRWVAFGFLQKSMSQVHGEGALALAVIPKNGQLVRTSLAQPFHDKGYKSCIVCQVRSHKIPRNS